MDAIVTTINANTFDTYVPKARWTAAVSRENEGDGKLQYRGGGHELGVFVPFGS